MICFSLDDQAFVDSIAEGCTFLRDDPELSDEELLAAGLVSRGQRGVTDRFRGRLMFPLRDRVGNVIAFGARRLPGSEDGPKYLNSPDGPLWQKGQILYGLDLAKTAIAKADRAIVVEGYTDVIALAQAGTANVVASMGTALTDRQLREISLLTRNVTLCFDADTAGTEASLRGLELAQKARLTVHVATPPLGSDPADVAAAGSETVAAMLNTARTVPAFRVELR